MGELAFVYFVYVLFLLWVIKVCFLADLFEFFLSGSWRLAALWDRGRKSFSTFIIPALSHPSLPYFCHFPHHLSIQVISILLPFTKSVPQARYM